MSGIRRALKKSKKKRLNQDGKPVQWSRHFPNARVEARVALIGGLEVHRASELLGVRLMF